MKVIQSLEDLQHKGPYLISGRVLSIENNMATIVIKWNLSAKIPLDTPGIEPDDYISASIDNVIKVEEIGNRNYIIPQNSHIITDLSMVLSQFRKNHPTLEDVLKDITDHTLLCILKQFLYKEITTDCSTWNKKKYFRIGYHTAPSARTYHHAYIGGNYIHSVGVAIMAKTIAQQKGISGLPLEVLITGALLHDIGKIKAFTPIKKKHLLTIRPTTVEIREHINIGLEIMDELYQFLKKHVKDTEKLHTLISAIKGLIETHHGLKSWGAKREPESILEQILFVSDYIDSRTGSYNPLNPSETDSLIKKLLNL